MKKNSSIFNLKQPFPLAGSQGPAVDFLCSGFEKNKKHQVLLGVTGSGKTFTIANVIQRKGVPALILAPNKTLAAQLFSEFKELFPHNAVEYFVSYYDYYQPEAYIPSSDTYIEKDSSINDQIDRMRHSATRALMSRKDVIIVSSVSCIYGLGSPSDYENLALHLFFNQDCFRDQLLSELVSIQYKRSDDDFHRGTFRVRGDQVDVFPPHEDKRAFRIEFFGDVIDQMSVIDPLTGENLEDRKKVSIYPVSHYVSTQEKNKKALIEIKKELMSHLKVLRSEKKILEMKRLKKKTLYDLEVIREMGMCPGIENYSRHFSGRKEGEPPSTLLEYFPKNFLMVVDESHITVPQVGGMYFGDRKRKTTLVEHGFRLPSALDNRPLNFSEFENFLDQVIYVSATPGPYELKKSRESIVEQIIRPTGLLDPKIFIHPTKNQVDHLFSEIKKTKDRVLVAVLTKKMAEDLTSYFQKFGIKARYLHSEIKTIERTVILKDLRMGVFQVLVGINLLREGLDLPEVGLVSIMDADKEGFLRSKSSLIQTMGRAARNIKGRVFLYADRVTFSMKEAMDETNRRRDIQKKFNEEHKIRPKTVQKSAPKELIEIYGFDKNKTSRKKSSVTVKKNIPKDLEVLRKQMKEASDRLDFEEARRIRDKIKRYELLELSYLEP